MRSVDLLNFVLNIRLVKQIAMYTKWLLQNENEIFQSRKSLSCCNMKNVAHIDEVYSVNMFLYIETNETN